MGSFAITIYLSRYIFVAVEGRYLEGGYRWDV